MGYRDAVLGVLADKDFDINDLDQTLEEAGIDSLDVMDIEFDLEEQFGVPVDVDKEELTGETTLRRYVELVGKALEKGKKG